MLHLVCCLCCIQNNDIPFNVLTAAAAVFITGMFVKYIIDLKQELHDMQQELHDRQQKLIVTQLELYGTQQESRDLKTEIRTLQQYKKMFFLPQNFTMNGVHVHMLETWNSEPFYTSPGGYKMYISVKCTHSYSRDIPVCLARTSTILLMPGEYDDQLKWPFHASFTFQIVSQNGSVQNFSGKVNDPNVCRASDGNPTIILEKRLDYITKEGLDLIAGLKFYTNRDSLTFKIS